MTCRDAEARRAERLRGVQDRGKSMAERQRDALERKAMLERLEQDRLRDAMRKWQEASGAGSDRKHIWHTGQHSASRSG